MIYRKLPKESWSHPFFWKKQWQW